MKTVFLLGPCLAAALALSPAGGKTSETHGAPKVGQRAPDFTLSGLGGKKSVQLHSLAGKVVLVDFWASWCAPCKRSLPELARLRARHPGLVVLAVSIDEERNKALDFLKGQDTALVALHDADRKVVETYDMGGMPSAVLIDKKGVLRYRHEGYTQKDLPGMEAEARALLEEKP